MNYEKKKTELKDFAKKNGLKISIRKGLTGYHSTVSVWLLAGEHEIFEGCKFSAIDFSQLAIDYKNYDAYVKQHTLPAFKLEKGILTSYGFTIMRELSTILLADHWEDFDPFTGYYDTDCFITLYGGHWDKNYIAKNA